MGTLRRVGNPIDLRLGARKARFGLGTRRRERFCLHLILAYAGIDLFLLLVNLALGCIELSRTFCKLVLCGIKLVTAVCKRGGCIIQLDLGGVELGSGIVELTHCRGILAIILSTRIVKLSPSLHCREACNPEVETHALETCDERIGNRVVTIAWIQFVGSACGCDEGSRIGEILRICLRGNESVAVDITRSEFRGTEV